MIKTGVYGEVGSDLKLRFRRNNFYGAAYLTWELLSRVYYQVSIGEVKRERGRDLDIWKLMGAEVLGDGPEYAPC